MPPENQRHLWKFFSIFLAILALVLAFQIGLAKFEAWERRGQAEINQ